jgi:S-DNA-T family DNA segregation ATPase FtsK/SpoIIIE
LTPVVTEPAKAVAALNWAVTEMENRYRLMSQFAVRNIEAYNAKIPRAATTSDEQPNGAVEKLPHIVIVVDEFADLMAVAGKEIEFAVQRLAQMARAAGIHLIMATQRPSVDIITGTIKANFPTRISFRVTSRIDSRTILNEQGAEQLLGQGDMLYAGGGDRIVRVHGAFVSDEEVEAIAIHLRSQGRPVYVDGITDVPEEVEEQAPEAVDEDHLYDRAVAIVRNDRKPSISYLQRKLGIGYNRAATLIERMQDDAIVSAPNSAGKRELLPPTAPEKPDADPLS